MHGVHAAFALDGFKEHGHYIGVAFGGLFQCLDVVHRYANEPFHQGAKAGLHLGVAGGAQGGNGAAVEGLLVHHDFGALNAFVVAKFACQLQGGFVGFQARRAEEHTAHAGTLDQQLGQLFLQGDVVVVGGVDQLGDLVLQRGDQLGVVVAHGVDGNTAQCIQVLAAIDVPHAAALTMAQGDGQSAIGVHHVG